MSKVAKGFLRGVLSDNSDGKRNSRRGVLLYTYLAGFITNIVTTSYFVGFMLEMGADEGYISIVNLVVTITAFLPFLSPLILEKMKRRKPYLITLRALYHFIYVAAMGVIPILGLEKGATLALFMAAVILGNVANAMSLSGVSIWHIESLPEEKRSDFFTVANVGSQVINSITGFCAGWLVDGFSDGDIFIFDLTPKMTAFLILRAFALLAALLELLALLKIKEYPYPEVKGSKVSLKMLFVPIRNRKFMQTIVVYIAYIFITALIGKYFEVYLLDVVGMTYTYKSLSSVISTPLVLIMSPIWAWLLRKITWQKVMPIAIFGTALGYFFNTLITANTQFFHIMCVVFYASFYVAVSIIFAFLPYTNMPEENRTAYISFFTISGSLASLLGNFCGMLFMNAFGWLEYSLFGLKITSYQTLNLIQTVLFVLLAIYSAVAFSGVGIALDCEK